MKPTTLASLLPAALLSLSLAGCGGSDKNSSSTPTGSATGTLTDGPVAGVQYTTSSGVSGTTDSSGHFTYNPGDTVTFKIGNLTLGQVTAQGAAAIITPLQIAQAATGLDEAARATLVTNLLVLLQSLDSDSDASNGITIPAAVSTAINSTVAGSINLNADSATFAANSALSGLVATAGGTLVNPDDALAHFKAQFLKDLAGVYVLDGGDEEFIAIRFNDDGSYIMGEVGTPDDAGQSGIERGAINWNPATGEITATVTLDTNGEWGLSHIINERLFFSLNGNNLVITEDFDDESLADQITEFPRLEQSTGIVGTWALTRTEDADVNLGVQQFIFLANGKYLMIDPVGDDDYAEPDDPKCGDAGLEYGHYSFALGVLTASGILTDTNDCAGLRDSDTDDYAVFSGVTLDNTAGTLRDESGDLDLVHIRTQAPNET